MIQSRGVRLAGISPKDRRRAGLRTAPPNALFITRKTAAAHVSNIVGKLEVVRRAEAAAIAARLGLLDDPTPERTA